MWGQASAPHRCHISLPHCVTLQSASMVALSLFCGLNAVSGPVWTRGRKQWVTSCHVGHCHPCQLSRGPENIPASSSDILTPNTESGFPGRGWARRGWRQLTLLLNVLSVIFSLEIFLKYLLKGLVTSLCPDQECQFCLYPKGRRITQI